MQWGVQYNFCLFALTILQLPCNLLYYRLQFGSHSLPQPLQQHHPINFLVVLHMLEVSIDLKKTIPFGLLTRKLSIVLFLLSIHSFVIVVHPYFFQNALCSSKIRLAFSTLLLQIFHTLILWYDGGLNPTP